MSSEHPKDNQECKSDDHTKHLWSFLKVYLIKTSCYVLNS